MEFLFAFMIIMAFMFIGEWVSVISKAYIPSVFVTAVLFIIGFWTFLPKDIAVKASYGKEFTGICVMLLLVHLGTIMDLKQLVAQWKAVVIALAGTVGTILCTMLIGTLIYDWHTVIAAIPPLTGGLVASVLMTDGLKEAGLTALVALPVSMFITHSMIGYPLTSVMLKKEGRRLKKEFHSNPPKEVEKAQTSDNSVNKVEKKVFNLPEKYQTSAFMLARLALVALLAAGFAQLLQNVINPNVVALIFGVIAHQLGFLESNLLNKAGVFNWLMYGLLAYVFAQLSITTPKMLGGIFIQILVLIALGILGMYIASALLAKPMGMSRPMAFATSLTAMFGFPADYILTNEVAQNLADTPEEKEYLLDNMMPKMLVGGFATVSVASVIIASIFLKLI